MIRGEPRVEVTAECFAMSLPSKLVFSLLGCASLAGAGALAAPAWEGGQKFSVVLTGANECTNAGVCGVGDLNASGTADITINLGQRRICWEITTAGVQDQYTIVGAHIHPGAAGVNGPAFIHLSAEKNGTATNCTSVTMPGPNGRPLTREEINQILQSPENYYVNVHWLPNFGPGAIRGQLTKGRLK